MATTAAAPWSLPADWPKLQPRPAAPVEKPQPPAPKAPVAPSKPVSVMSQDTLALTAPKLVSLPGVRAGQTLRVESGSFKGYSFGGQAAVAAFDGKTLDLQLNATAMFMSVPVHIRFDLQPDGSVHFVGDAGQMGAQQGIFKIQSQQGSTTVLRGAQGETVTLAAAPGGGIAIAYGDATMILKP